MPQKRRWNDVATAVRKLRGCCAHLAATFLLVQLPCKNSGTRADVGGVKKQHGEWNIDRLHALGPFLLPENSALRILGKWQRVLEDHVEFTATSSLRERKENWLGLFPSTPGGIDLLWKRSASEMTSTTRNGSIESLSVHGARHVSATAFLAALPDSAASRRNGWRRKSFSISIDPARERRILIKAPRRL